MIVGNFALGAKVRVFHEPHGPLQVPEAVDVAPSGKSCSDTVFDGCTYVARRGGALAFSSRLLTPAIPMLQAHQPTLPLAIGRE